jgi:type IV pilus assembly protein PilC
MGARSKGFKNVNLLNIIKIGCNMITYEFEAKNSEGQIVTGTLVAKDENTAKKILIQNDLETVGLTIQKGSLANVSFLSKVSVKDKAIFARQLATMLESGFPILQSLSVILLQTENKMLKSALAKIISDLEEGHSFSSALSKHPDVFNDVFISVVKAGEASGKLAGVLKQLATNTEREYSFFSKARGAIIYPIILIVTMLVIGILLMIKVIPQLESVFIESGAELPITTKIMMGISHFLLGYWWILVIILTIIIIGIIVYMRTDAGKLQFDYYKIKAPLVGKLMIMLYMARFTNTLSLLTKSGIPILDSLKITADSMANRIYYEAVMKVRKEVENGVALSVPMAKNPNFPPMVSQMVGVGEKTGNLDEVLSSLSKFYMSESDNMIKNLVSLLEPILIIIIGIAIGFLVFSILVPIYNLAQVY